LKNKYKIITFIVSTIICLIVIYLHLLSHQKAQKIYLQQTEKVIIDLKKDFLKDTVENIFSEINSLRKTKYNNYKKNINARLRRFQEELHSTDEEFVNFFRDRFKEDLNPTMWTALLWDNETGEILYSTPGLDVETVESTLENLKTLLSSYAVIEKDTISGIFGVSKSYIDDLVKNEMGDIIRNRQFSGDSYVWINEVINYEGGKDYAIRKVHPNLEDTEGTYLSTEMEDIKGNLPYLEELEGIKKNGELFFTYYFNKLNSEDISEKVTYAKLYKDYDWIIAMGVHLDDIDAYTERTNNEISSLSSESIIRLLRYILIVLLIGFVILYLIEKNHLSTSTRSLEKEINLDTLTKAASRSFGEKSLNNFFKQYKSTGQDVAIMMVDIDDFKDVNDQYGHEVGDIVLIEVVKTLNQGIRSFDQMIRWGGDEFVGIFPGLREEHMIKFGEKLLSEIALLKIPVEDQIVSVKVSMGFSYFKETDTSYNDVLKRADEAMYQSKQQGKNRVNRLI